MAEVFYTEDHEWVSIDGNTARVGITDYAQDQLGDVVYVELPEEGDEIEVGEEVGSVESVKSVSELIAPVSGTVSAINETIEDAPETANEDPEGEGWFYEVELDGEVDTSSLMDAAAYEEFKAEEA